ncbi:MAG: SusC/RagA family TonB-linked outer membrane protein [Saprospiraceae bacterium]|nr:SusC/RagA family TonB-linked outer membrane protein [Saprospiraceae bacterium]
MKKVVLSLLMLLGFVGFAAAQQKLTGKIINAQGEPMVGASVLVKGTATGTVTDVDGNFAISAPKGATLVVSFVGAQTQEVTVGSESVINVTLADSGLLEEVVVTQLGISRAKKSLGYTAQDLKADQLTLARDANVANALAGKIAGVQVLGQSGAKFGTPNIRVRGVNTLTGGDPLYVVDGTPTDISQVNVDDVESLTVLKGPAATALYGNRASSGVVIITTKRAGKNESKFEINQSTTFDQVSLLPKLQNEYGGGYSQDWETFTYNAAVHPASWASFNGQKILDYSADESWGPKIDGSLHRSAFSWQPGAEFGQLTPFSANPNNVRDFYNKPLSTNTNISFSKGTESFQTRISYTHIGTNGIVPNSSQGRDFISAKNTLHMTKNFTANLNINYTNTRTKNRPADQYGSSGGTSSTGAYGVGNAILFGYNQTAGSFNQWFQRQLRIEDLRDYKNADGTFRSWNIGGPTDAKPKYWDSPYTQVYENTNNLRSERMFGDFGLAYSFTDYLKLSGTVRLDLDNSNGEGRIAAGTLNEGGKGGFANYSGSAKEMNYEAMLNFNKTFDKLSVTANAGTNLRKNELRAYFQSTVGGLTTPGFYNIGASKDRPNVVNRLFERQVSSVFGNVSLGYNNFFYVEGSVRNDWSSTLPKENNSYFYPSVSTSIVVSELLPQNNILTYAKVRGGFAKVGTDVDPYQIYPIYNIGNPYGSNPVQTMPSRLLNQNLKPGLSQSIEAGIDLKFLKNKIGVEFTYYKNDNKDQIIPIPTAPGSGYTSALINAGNIQTKGLELHLNFNPVKTKTLDWNMDFNFDRSNSKVVQLAEGLTNYQLGSTWRGLTINAREGEEWGLFVGRKIQIDPASGKRIVGADGHYVYDLNQNLGSVLPKFKGGFVNSLNWKDIVFRFNIDFIVGGKFFSVTRMFNAYAGLAEETAGVNELGKPKRDPVANGGGILLDGVTADGKQNTTRVETQEFYEDRMFALHDYWIYDQTFVKLREVSLGYNVPKKLLGNGKGLKNAYIGLLVRNPLLLYSAIGGGIDISEAELYWTEGGQLPPVRSIGLNLRLGF